MKLNYLETATRGRRWAAPASLAAVMLVSASAATAEGRLTDTGGAAVLTATGDCVTALGGDRSPMEVCGDAMPRAAAATVEVVAAETAATATTQVMEKVAISATMLFDFDSAELSDDAKAVIDERIQALRGQVNLTSALRIEGHTCSTGAEAHNLQLSERRAQAVADYIVSQAYRVTASEIELVAKGESTPIASNDTREGRAKNRRVDIFVQGQMQP